MPDAFEHILGQPKVREFLRACVSQDKVSHAYLFTGPAGSNKTMAAFAFARAILCPQGPQGPRGGECGACDLCRRIARRKHPDVHFYTPEGASGYLVEQVRGIVSDCSLAPIQAKRKIYILDRVDLLSVQAANAFLKTLEEPPENVILILLGRTRESVLSTIVSRCQVVPFRCIPASEAAGIVVQNTGCSKEKARIALESCDGSLTRAVDFLKSNERLAFRTRVFEVLSCLYKADDWDIVGYAREFTLAAEAPLDVVVAEQEQELAQHADFLAKSAIRQIEAQNKRQLKAKTVESLHQISSLARSWLRDVAVICAEAPELVINVDVLDSLREVALRTDEARAIAALRAVRVNDEAISYNVSSETCIDAMLFEVRDILYDATVPKLGL